MTLYLYGPGKLCSDGYGRHSLEHIVFLPQYLGEGGKVNANSGPS
jgi:hypothetical protein